MAFGFKKLAKLSTKFSVAETLGIGPIGLLKKKPGVKKRTRQGKGIRTTVGR